MVSTGGLHRARAVRVVSETASGILLHQCAVWARNHQFLLSSG